jgi:hypothetical protein
MNKEQGYNEEQTRDNQQEGKDIIKGATNEDQLDKLKEAVPEGGRDAYPEKQSGTEPDAYQYERERENDDTTKSAGD